MNSSEEPDPPTVRRMSASGPRARPARGSEPRLIHRQSRISADWKELEDFLRQIPAALAPSPFSVCLLSDRSIRGYNLRFRQKNETTDVLSFPMGPPEIGGENYLGDILISVETANRNAARFGLRLENELKVLVLHGLLHLMGQDHERDHGQMARNERRWAARLGLAHGLLSRNPSRRRAVPPCRSRGSRPRSRQGLK